MKRLGLSPREVEVLTLIGQGLTNQEIATELLIGMNTVKTYIRTAYRRIGVESRSRAIIWAFKFGLVVVSGEDDLRQQPEVRAIP